MTLGDLYSGPEPQETDVPEWSEQLENDRGTAVPWEASVFFY